MEHANIRWTLPQTVQPHPPPVNVQTPYQPGSDWEFSSWIRDAETQTMPVQNLVREVFVGMILNRLRAKGLPLIACPHTRGLQLDNVINGIVDSHSVMCTHPNKQQDSQQQPVTQQQQQVSQQQQQPISQQQQPQPVSQQLHQPVLQQLHQPVLRQQRILPIPQQNVNESDLEVQNASQFLANIANSLVNAPPQITDNSETINPHSVQSETINPQSVQRKRPAARNPETSRKTAKRRKSSSVPSVYKCDKCDKTFELQRRLERHMAVHSQSRPFKCEKCEYRSKTAYECGRHFRRVHLNKHPHYCATCGKGYAIKAQVIRHEKQSHLNVPDKEKPFICKYCGKGFLLDRELIEHLALHEKSRQFKCDLCPHMSQTRRTRRRHINQTHQVFASRTSNKCLVCDIELHEHHLLIEHMKQNHVIAGIKCEECGAMFKNQTMLETHMKKDHWSEEMKQKEETRKLVEMDRLKSMKQMKRKKKVKDGEVITGPLDGKKKKKKVKDEEVTVSLGGEEKVFLKCKICGGMYASISELCNHLELHQNDNSRKAVVISEKTRLKAAIARVQNFVERQTNPRKKLTNDSSAKRGHKRTKVRATGQSRIKATRKSSVVVKKKTNFQVDASTSEDKTIRTNRTIIVVEKQMNNQNDNILIREAWKTNTEMNETKDQTCTDTAADKVSDQNQIGKSTTNKVEKSFDQNQSDTKGKSDNKQTKQNQPAEAPSLAKKPEKCFTIYTKSPDQVAQMLAKGQLKLSLNINIPGTSKTASVALSLPKNSSMGGASGSTSDNAATTGTSRNSSDSVTKPVTESSGQSDKPQSNSSVTEQTSSTPSPAKNTSTDGKQADSVGEQEKGIQQTYDDLGTESTLGAVSPDETQEKAAESDIKDYPSESKQAESTPRTHSKQQTGNAPSDSGRTQKETSVDVQIEKSQLGDKVDENSPSSNCPSVNTTPAGRPETVEQPNTYSPQAGNVSSVAQPGGAMKDQSKENQPADSEQVDGTSSVCSYSPGNVQPDRKQDDSCEEQSVDLTQQNSDRTESTSSTAPSYVVTISEDKSESA